MNFDTCPDVQVADPQDEDNLIKLMRLACEEDAQHAMNEEKVRSIIRPRLHQQGGLIGVIGGEELEAYVLLITQEVWYSTDFQLQELSLFVHPDHRRSNYAKQLMAFAKRVADGLGVDLTIGVLSNHRTEAKVRLYERQFKKAGAFFMYHGSAQ